MIEVERVWCVVSYIFSMGIEEVLTLYSGAAYITNRYEDPSVPKREPSLLVFVLSFSSEIALSQVVSSPAKSIIAYTQINICPC